MGLADYSNHWVALGAAVLTVAVLANNAVLASDESPPRSWDDPRTGTDETELRVTFQTNPGDRLTIDVGRSLFWLRLNPKVEGVVVQVYETPSGNALPNLDVLQPLHSYSGNYVNEEPRGLFFRPEPPDWTLRAQGFWTYVVIIRHGDYEPPAGQARALWAEGLLKELTGWRTWGATSSYTVVPNHALVLQPLFYTLQGAALAACVAGAVLALRRRDGAAQGLEQGVRLAIQARRWISTLHQLLWITTFGLLGLGLTLLMLLGGARFYVWTGLYPDAFYPLWMATTLVTAFVIGGTGLVSMLVRVRRASRNVPDLTLDD